MKTERASKPLEEILRDYINDFESVIIESTTCLGLESDTDTDISRILHKDEVHISFEEDYFDHPDSFYNSTSDLFDTTLRGVLIGYIRKDLGCNNFLYCENKDHIESETGDWPEEVMPLVEMIGQVSGVSILYKIVVIANEDTIVITVTSEDIEPSP